MGLSHSKAARFRAAAEANAIEEMLQLASASPQSALLKPSLWKQRTAAHAAARGGSAAALAVVLDVAAHTQPGGPGGGPPLAFLNAPDHAGDTALALAAKHGHAECVRELLDAGASPLPANCQGATAVHYAAARGHADCLRLCLTAPVRLADGRRCRAAEAAVPDVIDTERYIDTRTHVGLCALHLAVLAGSQAAVAELVSLGAQLDTPLLSLGFRGPAPVPPCLAAGSTALHMAAAAGRAQLCTLLLQAQQVRHPGLELRRMRNARGMTPLNVALLCQHFNLASLLTAGSSVPAPLPPLRPRAPPSQLPALLRQQLLALVHRAALLSQLRELGLGGAAAAGAPALPALAPGPVSRLESLLNSDSATAAQVLAAVDDLLDDAAATAVAHPEGSGRGAGSGAAGAGGLRGTRRRQLRRQQERGEQLAAQLAAAQAGVDWTLLARNRSLWHAEHAGPSALSRRLQRRRDQQRALAQPPQGQDAGAAAAAAAAAAVLDGVAAAGAAGDAVPASSEAHALMLAGALLEQAQEGVQQGDSSEEQQQQQEQQQGGGGGPAAGRLRGGGGGREGEAAAAVGWGVQGKEESAAGCAACCSAASSQAEGAVCPVCLDLPAGIAVAPCGHRACLSCCGRLASYSSSSSFGLPLQAPLCPLCRGPIESFHLAG